jgi:heterodisulfide reductase subunit A2
MMDVGRHPQIELHANSEVVDIKGYIGNFKVKILDKPRYVTADCTACGDCAKVCPSVRPNEFEMGLGIRKAVYIPFPQAVPARYIIDMEACLGNNPQACNRCHEECKRGAIDVDMREEVVEVEVGTILVATGMDVYDPRSLDDFGYTRFSNVVTSMEFERLINAGGPSKGHLIRLSDQKKPQKVAFIQCVGSRGTSKVNPYCSNICCMNTVKDTLLIKEHYPDIEVYVFYMDIRAFGKGFEDLYKRSKKEGVQYIRGLPSDIEETGEGMLRLKGENTLISKLYELDVDLVVLSVGFIPRHDMDRMRNMLNLSKTSDGFFMEAHSKLRPVDTSTGGIFLCGTAEGPKDIKEAVTQASAAAARAHIIMRRGEVKVEAITSEIHPEKCKACGLCAKVCPYKALIFDPDKKEAPRLIEAACSGCGTCGAECRFDAIVMRHFTDEQIMAQIDAATEHEVERKVVSFCCNWCSYAGADNAGTSRMQYPPNIRVIRTMCSGRVSEKFILRAFERGAPVVLVSGCHFGDCHYIDANYQTQKRINALWKKMKNWGIRENRLQLEWISAAEGEKFSRKMQEMVDLMETVTPDEVKFTIEVLQGRKNKETAKR